MNVGHIFKTKGAEVHAIGPDQPLTDAVALMMRHRIGSLAVLERGALLSIVTERDVMRAVHESLPRFSALRVRDVMAPTLVCCRAQDSIDAAMELLFNNELGRRVRHLPVMDGATLIGIISIGDLVQTLLTETRFENKLLRSYIRNWPEAEDAVAR
jgi:CBS domain-containing protein